MSLFWFLGQNTVLAEGQVKAPAAKRKSYPISCLVEDHGSLHLLALTKLDPKSIRDDLDVSFQTSDETFRTDADLYTRLQTYCVLAMPSELNVRGLGLVVREGLLAKHSHLLLPTEFDTAVVDATTLADVKAFLRKQDHISNLKKFGLVALGTTAIGGVAAAAFYLPKAIAKVSTSDAANQDKDAPKDRAGKITGTSEAASSVASASPASAPSALEVAAQAEDAAPTRTRKAKAHSEAYLKHKQQKLIQKFGAENVRAYQAAHVKP